MTSGAYAETTRDWTGDEREQIPPASFLHLDSIPSTNTLLRERLRAEDASPFSLIVADHQTAGRGRRGDRWEASPGSNLLFSLALALPEDTRLWSQLPHLTAMIVGSAVESILTCPQILQAKWPNDLLFESRKLCGILVETTTSPRNFAIVGVGLNVNMKREEFSPGLREQATSVREIEGCEASRWFLLNLILRSFLHRYPEVLGNFGEVLDWYRERDYLRGKRIHVSTVSGDLIGKGKGLGVEGELLLEKDDGEVVSILSCENIGFC